MTIPMSKYYYSVYVFIEYYKTKQKLWNLTKLRPQVMIITFPTNRRHELHFLHKKIMKKCEEKLEKPWEKEKKKKNKYIFNFQRYGKEDICITIYFHL